MESREQTVAKLLEESQRLQYDEGDNSRIYDASEKITESFIYLLKAIGEVRDELEAPVDEDSGARMADARMHLVETYANALVQLHKLGSVFRISGEAFDRMVEYLSGPEDAQLVMSDL